MTSASERTDRYQALASLPFADGHPTDATARTLEEELFFQRAVQTYLWALPTVNACAMRDGLGEVFGRGYQVMNVFEQRLKPRTLITTPNCDVIYGMAFADLSATGPLVVEAPPGIQGLVDDFWHRPLTGPLIDGVQYLGDIGLPGPDHGKGGRYLIVPDDSEPETEGAWDEYFVYRSPTDNIYFLLRGFFSSVDDLSPGVASIEGIRLHPLDGEATPMRFAHASDTPADALYPRDASFYDVLDAFVQADRIDRVDPYMHGVLAALGIRKGQAFSPTPRQRELLEAAALTAWKTAKTLAAGYNREPDALWWADRQWVAHAKTAQDDFWHTLLDEQFRTRATGHTDVNAKAHMFVNHYSISTGMISSVVGFGAKYAGAYRDHDGELLRGEHTYRIDLPADPPARLFWSLTLYDAETAAEVDVEGQVFSSLNGMNDIAFNDDKSITIHIGPERPDRAENWIRTAPDRGWFALIRWYGPQQAFFDRKYKPGDFVRTTEGDNA
ncbi:hypothetical protein BIV57_02540 [Mangrovactinospora gilvigrisea]|uniref:DUF1254 domain-containing protein n=1 Tax=Mangrovactinospora gilvigrisea TaxID=1428644 RepID=A0A1J7BJZ0_9ACTN|nr:DUF1254 domain-containing protein [Mangrovactinospora gilvigrisea]OIV39003.1 hypothetical protein BIV57_02540 [Mangrovactinospora gilvigrisea]